jgi:hypothetical protein
MTAVPIFTTIANPHIGNSSEGPLVGLKIQLASDSSGDYVPVVALDADLGISIGSVSQQGTWTVGRDNKSPLNLLYVSGKQGGGLFDL